MGKKTIYEFSEEKNLYLISERGISFEEIISAIGGEGLLDIIPHPNLAKYPNQKMYVININGYVFLAPFVKKSKDVVFLKTIFPHGKATKYYLRGNKDEK